MKAIMKIEGCENIWYFENCGDIIRVNFTKNEVHPLESTMGYMGGLVCDLYENDDEGYIQIDSTKIKSEDLLWFIAYDYFNDENLLVTETELEGVLDLINKICITNYTTKDIIDVLQRNDEIANATWQKETKRLEWIFEGANKTQSQTQIVNDSLQGYELIDELIKNNKLTHKEIIKYVAENLWIDDNEKTLVDELQKADMIENGTEILKELANYSLIEWNDIVERFREFCDKDDIENILSDYDVEDFVSVEWNY